MTWQARNTGEGDRVEYDPDSDDRTVERIMAARQDGEHVWFANMAFHFTVEEVRAAISGDGWSTAPHVGADKLVSVRIICGLCGAVPTDDYLSTNDPCPGSPS